MRSNVGPRLRYALEPAEAEFESSPSTRCAQRARWFCAPPSLTPQQLADPLDQLLDVERLLHELVGAALEQVVDLVLVHHARHDDDLRVLERRVLADRLADHVAVDVRQHVVQDDQVGHELLRDHAGVVAAAGGLDLKSAIPLQHVHKQLHNFRVIVHDQDLGLAAVQRVRRNVVVLHELKERLARNPPKPAARNAETLESPAVEAANDRLLGHLANFRGLAGREDGLHG
jgi:hypothetical protein